MCIALYEKKYIEFYTFEYFTIVTPPSTTYSFRCSFIVGLFPKNKGLPFPNIIGIIPIIYS